VIYCCFALNNFILMYGKEEDGIEVADDDVEGPDDEDIEMVREYEADDRGKREMERKRDRIAERLWNDYSEVATQRSRR
jgi:hypothetical protein